MFQSPGAILFELGPLTIRWYGLMIALGFLLSTFAATRMARRWGIDPDKVINGALLGFIAGIIGARLYFVALSWNYFADHPAEILATWNGGLSIHGGILFGMLGGVVYCKAMKLPVLRCLDIAGTATALGQAVGRWGNFFNSEAFGRPTPPGFPLRLYIPEEARPREYFQNEYFHPTFLYESIWDLMIFAVLYYFVADKLKPYPGVTFLVYIAAYSVGRMVIEMLRTDSIMAYGMPVPIIASAISVVLAVMGISGLMLRYTRAAKPKT
jgi:phosphatidylglycerol:prolipoprotein diacylglycerol transferase